MIAGIELAGSRGRGSAAGPAAGAPLTAVLRQLADLLERLTDEQYARKPVGVVPSSIGGHVRHCLDHVTSLLAGLETGLVDYDRRQRGTDAERSRTAALEALRRLERELAGFPWPGETRPLRLSALLTPGGSPVEVTTSLGRELAFLLSHTVHHNALVAVIASLLGVPTPARFGYAPSTIAGLERSPCVR